MKSIQDLYDQGKIALINGIGYPNPNRSHFRSMDIWHTCEPDKMGNEGWLGRVIRDLDPNAENVLTGVNFGRGLPRALALNGVPVASVAELESYGVLTGIADPEERLDALDLFSRMYSPILGTGPVMDYLGQTGLDALKGADILKTAPGLYQSSVEYANTPIGPESARNRQGTLRRSGDENFLHPTYRLRHPRQSRAHPARFARRSGSGFVGFSPRFAGARPIR